jgi:ABC-type Fe3+ transport system permease subunit
MRNQLVDVKGPVWEIKWRWSTLALKPRALAIDKFFIVKMFADFNPHIFFGGDNATFWKPLSWTIIFGLAFAFFMTLIMVPAMYLIAERLKRPMRRMFGGKWISMLGIPPFTLLFMPLMIIALWKHRKDVKRRKSNGNRSNDQWNESWF